MDPGDGPAVPAGQRLVDRPRVCRSVVPDNRAGRIRRYCRGPTLVTGDTVGLAQLSEPSIGPAIEGSVAAMLGDFQDQQRHDAARYSVHSSQAQQAVERINVMRGPLLATCRAELLRLLQEWDAQGPVSPPR